MEERNEAKMYPIVEDYLINKLTDLGFDKGISSNNAAKADLSLALYGSYIKPDVYCVGENEEGLYRISMAEGKTTYKGRELDGIIWQGISDQRFSHFVYIFFPKNEVSGSNIRRYLIQECSKFGLGLLLVDVSHARAEEIHHAELSPFLLDKNETEDFERNCLTARSKIRINLGKDTELERVHLATLRDLSILLKKGECWSRQNILIEAESILLPEYLKLERTGKKSSMAKYDFKVRRSVIGGDAQKFREIINRNLNTLLFFGLVVSSADKIELTPLGMIFANADRENKYSIESNEEIKNSLTYLLLTTPETRQMSDAIYNILTERAELPVWAKRKYCPNSSKCDRECGFRNSWTPEGQMFPTELKYSDENKKHNCEIGKESFDFDALTVSSLLYCSFGLPLPEKMKILISESTLVKQRGATHLWSLGFR